MMKIKRDQLISRLRSQPLPSVAIPYLSGDQSPNSVFSNLKTSIEWAIKSYVDQSMEIMLNEIYTTEDFEDDMGLNKPK